MGNPIHTLLQSVHHLQDVASFGAFSQGPDQTASLPHTVTATSTVTSTATAGTIVSTTGLTGAYEDYVGLVFEALDGNVKGQLVICTGFNEGTDTATTTPFWRTSGITTTQFKIWKPPWPIVAVTSAGSTTEHTTAERDEADDTWIGHYLLWLNGDNAGEIQQVSDSASGAQTITTAAFSNASADGDVGLLVNPLAVEEVEIGLSPGIAIERATVTDTLAKEGVLVGGQEPSSLRIMPEIRGLGTAAGDGVAASAPTELHALLSSLFTETLDTGDVCVASGSDADTVIVDEATAPVSQYSLVLINGEVAAVESVTSGTPADSSTIELVHSLSSVVADNDVMYAGANYAQKNSGHTSASFLVWQGGSPQKMSAFFGGLPSLAAEISGNVIGKYDFSFSFNAGLACDRSAGHTDPYDSSAPVVGRANVCRTVFDLTELDGDVISAAFNFLPTPEHKTAAFSAFENRGGVFYRSVDAGCTLVIQQEDTSYRHRYRAGDEFDLLVQVGSVATNAWAVWAPRAQIVAIEEAKDNNVLQWSITCRFLRPSTSGQPAFVITHF